MGSPCGVQALTIDHCFALAFFGNIGNKIFDHETAGSPVYNTSLYNRNSYKLVVG